MKKRKNKDKLDKERKKLQELHNKLIPIIDKARARGFHQATNEQLLAAKIHLDSKPFQLWRTEYTMFQRVVIHHV